MADLLDIVPATAVESVHVDGGRVTVRGLNGHAIASIVARFPQVGSLLGGGNLETKLIGQFGFAIAPIIAGGCGHLGDEKYEQAAAEMLPEDQLRLVAAIIRLTFPNGLTSFATTLRDFLIGPHEGEKPVTMRLKKSPSTSPPSSDADSQPTLQ